STQAPVAGADPPTPHGYGVESKPALTWAAQGARGVENSIVKRKDSSGHPMSHTRPLGARNAEGPPTPCTGCASVPKRCTRAAHREPPVDVSRRLSASL